VAKARANPTVPPVLRVVAAAIRRDDGALLLSVRPAHTAHGGLWEFPGGKLESRERPIDGLARELAEELGITIDSATPLISVRHRYPANVVELMVFEVRAWQGEAHGREGQRIEWVSRHALADLEFPAANLPVTTAVSLPRVVLITPDLGVDEAAFLARLEACVAAGVEMVQLRIRAAAALRQRVVVAARTVCARHGARLMLNGAPHEAREFGADGVHLNRQRLFEYEQRPVAKDILLSAACHDARELAQAERIGVDFVYLSPVAATASHPGAQVLGWAALRSLCATTRLPVYALGGMTPRALPRAVRAGCQGIAMLSGLWESTAPAALLETATRALQKAAYRITPR
jgi:8-oxo-dGTP diphosphatase